MKKLKIKKFDGTYFLCEDKDKKMFAIEKSEMPVGANEGNTIIITSEGIIELKENKQLKEK